MQIMKKRSQVVTLSKSLSVTCVSDGVEHRRSHCPACIFRSRPRGGCRGCSPTPYPQDNLWLSKITSILRSICLRHPSVMSFLGGSPPLTKILDPTLISCALFMNGYLLTAQWSCPFWGHLMST